MRRERGSITMYAIAVGLFLGLITGVIAQATVLIRLQHEVAKAADLAALAASQAAASGSSGCAKAEIVAGLNNAVVIDCQMDQAVATITTRAESETVWGQRFAFERKARAAPLSYLDGDE